ncbi:MAG TPA: hypothetical protein VMX38_16530 [Verrucomicrobiae bacterium]|jgi:hypothetical protein|nr:hypothetical protein [Verrucomicrobiae bacterium]
MTTARRIRRFAWMHAVCTVALCLVSLCAVASTNTAAHSKKAKKVLAPLPSGPTGPVPQIPLDSMRPVAPQVSFENGQLSILAPNSTLGDILRAVRKQTGAEIDVPNDAQERVVTHLGPGPARDVMADLLNGSRFNYVLLGSPENPSALTRVVLVAKSGPENPAAPGNSQPQQPAIAQVGNNPNPNMAPPPDTSQQDATDADATDDSNNSPPDENADQQPAADADQQPPASDSDQQNVKTPQQMLQEMQQRQMQLQQLQQPGQAPGSGMPPHPPQEP